MDNNIEDIKRLAGIQEQETYSLGKQEDMDKLVENEVEFLRKTAEYLNNVRLAVSRGNVINPRQINVGMVQIIKALANRIEALGEYRDVSRTEKP